MAELEAAKRWKTEKDARAQGAPSQLESAVRGGIQGSSGGLSDEIVGAAKSIGVDPTELAAALTGGPASLGSYIGNKLGFALGGKGAAAVTRDYRSSRDEERGKNKEAEQANPKTYGATQFAGGVVSGAATAPATLLGTVAAGAGIGATTALGESEADLTRGEFAKAAEDTAKGGLAGAAGSGIGYGVAKGAGLAVKNARRALSPAYRLTTDVAEELPKQSTKSTTGQTVQQFAKESDTLAAYGSKLAGEALELSPGQKFGSKTALGMERTAAQMPEHADDMLSQQSKRLEVYGKALDGYVKHVAAHPEQLGNLETGARVAKAVDRYVGGLRVARREATAPGYREAVELLGNEKVIPTGDAVSIMARELANRPTAAQQGLVAIKQTIDDIERTSQNGMADLPMMQQLRSYWREQASGTGDVFKDMAVSKRKQLAGTIADAIDGAISSAAENARNGMGRFASKTKIAAGLARLKETDALYHAHSEQIRGASTATIKQILRLGKEATPDKIASTIMQRSPSEVAGIAKILAGAGDGSLQQLRANTINEIFSAAGKPSAAKGVGDVAEGLGANMSPAKIAAAVKKHRGQLNAMFIDDPEAARGLNQLAKLGERLAQGPGVAGSDTMAKLGYEGAMRSFMRRGDSLAGMIREAAEKRFFSKEGATKLLADPKTSTTFAEAVASVAHPSTTGEQIRRATVAFTRLLALATGGAERSDATMPRNLRADAEPQPGFEMSPADLGQGHRPTTVRIPQ